MILNIFPSIKSTRFNLTYDTVDSFIQNVIFNHDVVPYYTHQPY